MFSIKNKIFLYKSANQFRIKTCKNLNANIIFTDPKLAFQNVKAAEDQGYTFIHPFDGAYTLQGTSTLGYEIFNQIKDIDNVVISIGGGGLISGVGSFLKQLNPKCKIIGIEPEGARGMTESIKNGYAVKNVVIDTIDLDEEMLTIAKDWFGFKDTHRLHGFVGDGIEFVNKKVVEKKKYHVVIIDVDSKDLSEGLLFPPRPFMTEEFLKNVYEVLDDNGILIVNLASRAQNVFDECILSFKSVFDAVCLIPIEADVNKVIFCMKHQVITSSKDTDSVKAYKDKLNISAQRITENASKKWDETIDLNDWTSQLQFIC